MTITTDERPYDMANWVSEKADSVLSNACHLADWLRHAKIDDAEKDRIGQFLYQIIDQVVTISAFGHENLDGLTDQSQTWVKLMLYQGHERFIEFQGLVKKKLLMNIQPSEWPISIQRTIDLFSKVEELIITNPDDKTQIRAQVAELGRNLQNTQFGDAQQIGDKLLELIDQQSHLANISWDKFVQKCSLLIQTEQSRFINQAEKYLEPC